DEALLIEPTETETRETLDRFATIVAEVLREAQEDPEIARGAPYSTPVRRLDEAGAARNPVLRQQFLVLGDVAHGRALIALVEDADTRVMGLTKRFAAGRAWVRQNAQMLAIDPIERRPGGRAGGILFVIAGVSAA